MESNYNSITVSRGVTVNLGNYESVRFDISITDNNIGSVDKETVATATAQMTAQISEYIKSELARIEKAGGLVPRGAARFTGSKE